jgi:hypothetical protein
VQQRAIADPICDCVGADRARVRAPRNVLSYTTIILGALSIASVIFVLLDLDTPFDGIFAVSS